MLSDRLKENTKNSHQELEKLLIQKIKSVKVADDYAEILIHFYNFYGSLEHEIISHIGNKIPYINKRRKSKSIVDDLHFLGWFPPKVTPLYGFTNNYYQALGAFYVLEGSTLGGKIICNMISQRLDMDPNMGFTFFTGYGEATPLMWQDFKGHLNYQSPTKEEEFEIITAANKTFLLLKQSLTTEINY